MNHPEESIESVRVRGAHTRRVWLSALAIFALAMSVYLPTLRNGFVWDDVALTQNPDVRVLDWPTLERLFTSNYWQATEASSGMYRPLTALSLHTDYRLHGSKPAGYHLTNMLFHAVASALVLLVLLELFGSLEIALLAALLFAVFPMHVENVAWVSGRTDLIAVTFMLLSLWCYARWRSRGTPLMLAGVVVWLVAGLLAKETAIVLPAVVAVAELLPLERGRSRRERMTGAVAAAALFVVALLYLALRKHVLGASLVYFHRFTHGLAQAIALCFSILAHYVYKLVFPFRLDVESDFPPPRNLWNLHVVAGIALLAFACYSIYRWRRHRALVFGMAVIGLGLAPVLNIVPVDQILAERFLYFPSVGYCLLVALAVVSLRRRWRLAVTLAFALFLAACSVRTVMATLDWKDELTLFEKAVAISGDNARARASLGGTLYDLGRYDEALNEYRFAVRLNPSYSRGWAGLARTEGKLGHVTQALTDMQTALDLEPENALYYHSLGLLQFQARDYFSAIGSFRTALQLRPRHFHARFNLGLALYQIGDFEGAVREFTALENKDTDFPNAYFFMAESELRRGNHDEAVKDATHFLSIHRPDDALTTRAREIVAGAPP